MIGDFVPVSDEFLDAPYPRGPLGVPSKDKERRRRFEFREQFDKSWRRLIPYRIALRFVEQGTALTIGVPNGPEGIHVDLKKRRGRLVHRSVSSADPLSFL
jgi:hypothetical protein